MAQAAGTVEGGRLARAHGTSSAAKGLLAAGSEKRSMAVRGLATKSAAVARPFQRVNVTRFWQIIGLQRGSVNMLQPATFPRNTEVVRGRRSVPELLSAGGQHTCTLTGDGAYECIGNDKYGQSNGKKKKWPLKNPGGTIKNGVKYVQVSAG